MHEAIIVHDAIGVFASLVAMVLRSKDVSYLVCQQNPTVVAAMATICDGHRSGLGFRVPVCVSQRLPDYQYLEGTWPPFRVLVCLTHHSLYE